jgi:hypothetical protein
MDDDSAAVAAVDERFPGFHSEDAYSSYMSFWANSLHFSRKKYV